MVKMSQKDKKEAEDLDYESMKLVFKNFFDHVSQGCTEVIFECFKGFVPYLLKKLDENSPDNPFFEEDQETKQSMMEKGSKELPNTSPEDLQSIVSGQLQLVMQGRKEMLVCLSKSLPGIKAQCYERIARISSEIIEEVAKDRNQFH